LLQHIQKVSEDDNIEWIINAQMASQTSPIYYSQFLTREDSNILDLDKLETNSPQGHYSATIFDPSAMEISQLRASDRKISEKTASTLPISPKIAILRSQIFMSFQSKLSAKQELKKNLLNQLENPNHIILGLAKTFVSACKSLFNPQLEDPNLEKDSPSFAQVFPFILDITRRFLRILREFTSWIYEDLLLKIENGLDQEDLNPDYVIESVLFGLVFKAFNSFLSRLIIKLLTIQHKESIDKAKVFHALKGEEPLESYDDILKRATTFLMKATPTPYIEVIRKMRSVQNESNPYSKFEVLASLEEEMWSSLCTHYKEKEKEDHLFLIRLREGFGMDLRLPIMIYSIVQTQYDKLIIERMFIEEFVNPQTIDISLAYTNFRSSLDYLLDGSFAEQQQQQNELEIELQGLDERELLCSC